MTDSISAQILTAISKIDNKLDELAKAYGELKNELTRKSAELGGDLKMLDRDQNEMRDSLRRLEDQSAATEKELREHLSHHKGRDDTRSKTFEWSQLLTPVIVTIGLAVIGWLITIK